MGAVVGVEGGTRVEVAAEAGRGRWPAGVGGGGGAAGGKGSERMWKNKPSIPDDKFSCLKNAFMQKCKEYCWGNIMHGCSRSAADCREKHKWPPGFAALCKGCGVDPPTGL